MHCVLHMFLLSFDAIHFPIYPTLPSVDTIQIVMHTFSAVCWYDAVCIVQFSFCPLMRCSFYWSHLVLTVYVIHFLHTFSAACWYVALCIPHFVCCLYTWCSVYWKILAQAVEVLHFVFDTKSRLLMWCSLFCTRLVLTVDMMKILLHTINIVS